MPLPSIQQVHTNAPLTNLSVAFMQDPRNFVAGQIFPKVPVMKQSDKYYTYDREYWFRTDAQRRAAGSEAARGGYKLSDDSYFCDRWALGKAVDDPTRANADDPIQLDAEATEYVSSQLALRAEVDWATKYFATGIWTTNPTVSTLWSDAASDPVSDCKTQGRTVERLTGLYPNVFVLGRKAFDDLCLHPDILDRIKFAAGPGNPAIANENTLAQVFGVSRVVVAKAIQNTAAEGRAKTMAYVFDPESALLLYAAPSPGIRTVSAGYIFTWLGGTGNDFGVQVKRYRDEPHESDIVEGNMWYDMKVVAADLGVFFSNATAA